MFRSDTLVAIINFKFDLTSVVVAICGIHPELRSVYLVHLGFLIGLRNLKEWLGWQILSTETFGHVQARIIRIVWNLLPRNSWYLHRRLCRGDWVWQIHSWFDLAIHCCIWIVTVESSCIKWTNSSKFLVDIFERWKLSHLIFWLLHH